MTDWMRARPIATRLAAARQHLPPGALELACHAALPVALDTGFLNLLRVNFFLDPPIVLPYEAEAALLLSPLCRELGEGLYEIDPLMRRALLASLVSRFGAERVTRVALLLERYTDQTPAWHALPELDHAQRLTALSHLDPRGAVEWLDRARAVAGAGPSPLGREWFVAMRARLRDQPSPEDSLDTWQRKALAEVAARTDDVEAVRRLGELALLPGSDLTAISKALVGATRRAGPAGRTAQEVLDSLVHLVEPPARDDDGDGNDDVDPSLTPVASLTDLLGLDHPDDFDPRRSWRRGTSRDQLLKVPIGVDEHGGPVELDLKEPALDGMGPHGLCVGATGSGKSELLRTVVLALAMTHPPDLVAFLLVDYRGGATFAGLDGLPHTAAVVSNLGDESGLVDRLQHTLRGELIRRQELLRDAGRLASITDYHRGWDAERGVPPLPYLLVVVDEFDELITAEPSFAESLRSIGRVGRSLGVHLLLASQRIQEGRLHGLEVYLSYRLGLRALTEQDSRAVLGVPDAYHLPPLPGIGYLKVDTTVFQRFTAAYVSGPYRHRHPRPPSWDELLAEETAPEQEGMSLLDMLVSRMAGLGETYQIWLPPLPRALPLAAVTGPLAVEPGRGLTVADAERRGTLRVPVGLVDRPAEHSQAPFLVDLAVDGGHLGVFGAPGTGKARLLRTLVTGAALTHTPRELAFYCVDLGSSGLLNVLAGLPHVGAVAGRSEPDRVRRVVRYVSTLLEQRRQLLAGRGVNSVDELRRLHRRGGLPELPAADIVLIVYDHPTLRRDHEDLADVVQDVALQGPGYGVHLVVTAGRWADLRAPLQAAIGSKIEFRLRDPAESAIDRRAAQNLPYDTPGRCLTAAGLTAQVALPQLNEGTGIHTSESGLGELVDRVASAWPGPRVPVVRMLPGRVDYAELANTPTGGGIRLGLAETDLGPVLLDLFGAEQHLLTFGDQGSGKTSLLRLVARDLTAQYTHDQVVFVVVDPRRTLRDVVPEPYLGGYANTEALAEPLARAVVTELRKRLPPDDVTVDQLRDRSWWQGPELVVLCDDYDLLGGAGASPLTPLLTFLPQSRDLGLHLVVTRHSAGAGRAVYEPVLTRMRELGCTGLLLSGDRREGALWPQTYLGEQPPGRGRLVRRGQPPTLVQLAYVEEQPG
ncbi:type VII secretion protein EccCb [Plantactinospora sonchi]|uniref:Type VII secretion protein EccCb n=1 Tax=Plantactinospora sonchi TaxID=1544735 RepID=A0ABU7S2X2_9ACTN